MGTQQADGKDTGIDCQVHYRAVPGNYLLRLTEDVVDSAAGALEFLRLVLFPDIGLHHADGGYILLHTLVQHIISGKCLAEILGCSGYDNGKNGAEEHDRDQIHTGQLRTDIEGHEHGKEQTEGCTHTHSQDHLIGILNICHIGSQSCDQSGGAELIDVGKAEGLDILIHRFSQVLGKACGSLGSVHTSADTEHQTEYACQKHQHSHKINMFQIPLVDAIINNRCHQQRKDGLHDDLTDHKDGGQD